MRKIFFILIYFVVCGFCSIEAQSNQPPQQYTAEQHLQAVRDLMDVLNMKQSVARSIARVKDTQLAGMAPQQRQKFEDYYDRCLSWEELEPEIVAAYDQVYTMQELTWMCKFYKTPFGKKQVQSAIILNKKIEGFVQQKMEQHEEELKTLYKEILTEEIQKAKQQRAARGGAQKKN